MNRSGETIEGVALVSGRATGATLALDEPLSFWGGLDAVTGAIVDTHHPQLGESVVGKVIVMPSGRGSSSSSSVIAEAIRNHVGPVAIVLRTADPIIALGCLVAQQLYGASTPVVVLEAEPYRSCAMASELTIDAAGDTVRIRIAR
jgi:hypothetical protein